MLATYQKTIFPFRDTMTKLGAKVKNHAGVRGQEVFLGGVEKARWSSAHPAQVTPLVKRTIKGWEWL